MSSTAKKKKATAQASKNQLKPPLPVIQVPLDKIDPSPLNRDATTDIVALTGSIKAHGQQQAIKLRTKGDRFEIVYGERRWRAVKQLGQKVIDATVEDLSDVEAANLRATENYQRANPHALEEAEEYERLLAMRDEHGEAVHTPQTVARLAARSAGHIYNRLKLTALAPTLRKAVYKQDLSLTGAFVIARGIPADLQAEAWQKMQEYARDEAPEEDLDDDGHLTRRAIQMIVDHDYTSLLSNAPFSLKDAKLVPGAGTCDACPNRSGNQPFLFDQKTDRKDTCTNLTCFRSKVAAYVDREKKRVLELGGKVLSDDESRKLFQGGSSLPFGSKWMDLDQPNYDDSARRSWRNLLGDLSPSPVLAFTAQSKPVLLAEKSVVQATLKAHGLDPAALVKKPLAAKARDATTPAAGGGAATHHDDPEDEDLDEDTPDPHAPASPAEQRFKADVDRISRQRILGAIVTAAEAAATDDNRFVDLVLDTTLHGGFHNAIIDAVKRRLGHKRPKGESAPAALQDHLAKLGPAGLRGLLLELAISRSGYYVTASTKYSRDLQRAIDAYGIDAAAIEKAVSDEISAKRAARLSGAKASSA
jgi:ParB family chromosome partitioning protein